MAHLSFQNLMQGPTSHARNFRRLRLQKQSLRTPPRGYRVHHAARATRHWELAATQRTEFESNPQSPTPPGESCPRLPAGLLPHRHLWCHCQSTWSAQKGDGGDKRMAICCLLQMTCVSPTICNCLLDIFGFSMLSNAVKETGVTMALNIGKKNTASQRTGQTSQPSLQDEALREDCFSQIGPAGAAQLLPGSRRNVRATCKVQLLQGRVAQDFQQVCGPTGTGVFVEAPGVLKRRRWGYTGAVGGWHIERSVYAI